MFNLEIKLKYIMQKKKKNYANTYSFSTLQLSCTISASFLVCYLAYAC